MKALFIITDGFEDIEFNATRDVLVRAGINVVVASARAKEDDKPIVGKTGSEVVTHVPLDSLDIDGFEILVVPGGPQVDELSKNEKVLEVIKGFATKPEKFLAAICAAPTILGNLGLLKGKNYTVFPTMNKDYGGTFQQQYVVVDGHLTTGDGPAASIAFGLAIVETTMSKAARDEVAKGMFYED